MARRIRFGSQQNRPSVAFVRLAAIVVHFLGQIVSHDAARLRYDVRVARGFRRIGFKISNREMRRVRVESGAQFHRFDFRHVGEHFENESDGNEDGGEEESSDEAFDVAFHVLKVANGERFELLGVETRSGHRAQAGVAVAEIETWGERRKLYIRIEILFMGFLHCILLLMSH